MATTSTMYAFTIALADSDRAVYEDLKFSVALHPSESLEFMATRVLAFCLEYENGLSFSKGLANPDEPSLWTRAPDGQLHTWIDIGLPDPARLHKATKAANKVCVYAHRDPKNLLRQAAEVRVHRGTQIKVVSFEGALLDQLCSHLDRRNQITISVSDRHLYISIGDHSFESRIVEVPLIPEVAR